MKITEHIKREYSSPKLTCTLLDIKISLEIQSAPPEGPGEGQQGYNNAAPEFFNKNNPLNA